MTQAKDSSHVNLVSHLVIRDPNTQQIILNKPIQNVIVKNTNGEQDEQKRSN